MVELVKLRAKWLKKWVETAKDLESDEIHVKDNMPEYPARILALKRILLRLEILQEARYPDLGVVDELVHGRTVET